MAPRRGPETIATAIRIGSPASWNQAVAAKGESGGMFRAATDEAVGGLPPGRGRDGVFVEPASAASVAGRLLAARADGWIEPGSTVVYTVTGNGLKDPDTALLGMPEVAAIPVDPGAVAQALGSGSRVTDVMTVTLLPAGLRVGVRVPASSANLGPGFDCLGLALGICDDLTVTTIDEPGVRLSVTGEGADSVPFDDTHLVARAVARGLSPHAGAAAVGLQIDCVNAIPHSRGVRIVGGSPWSLGSSLPQGCSAWRRNTFGAQSLSDAELVQLSGEFEGHRTMRRPASSVAPSSPGPG